MPSGWQEYYEAAVLHGDDAAWREVVTLPAVLAVDMRAAEIAMRAQQYSEIAHRRVVETWEPPPEGTFSYERTCWLEYETGLKAGTWQERLADLTAAKRLDYERGIRP